MPEVNKSNRQIHVEWISKSAMCATVKIGLNGQEAVDSDVICHPGGGAFDTAGHAFDTPGIGFDRGGDDVGVAEFEETIGSTVNCEIDDTSLYSVGIKSLTFSFRMMGQRLSS